MPRGYAVRELSGMFPEPPGQGFMRVRGYPRGVGRRIRDSNADSLYASTSGRPFCEQHPLPDKPDNRTNDRKLLIHSGPRVQVGRLDMTRTKGRSRRASELGARLERPLRLFAKARELHGEPGLPLAQLRMVAKNKGLELRPLARGHLLDIERVDAPKGDGRGAGPAQFRFTRGRSLVRSQLRPFRPAWLLGFGLNAWVGRAGSVTSERPVQTPVQTSRCDLDQTSPRKTPPRRRRSAARTEGPLNEPGALQETHRRASGSSLSAR